MQEVRCFYPFFPAIGRRALEAFEWRGHRFEPGEWITIGLMQTLLRLLVTETRYSAPRQNFWIDLSRMPAIPASRVVPRDAPRVHPSWRRLRRHCLAGIAAQRGNFLWVQ